MPRFWIDLAYLIASVLFIFALKGMTHPRTAVRGNQLGVAGMALAVLAALLDPVVGHYVLILAGIAIGAGIGVYIAKKVKMEQMPEMVALLNGLGGGASVLVAGSDFWRSPQGTTDVLLATALSGIIGSVTLLGSLIAFGKLAELEVMQELKPLPQQYIVCAALAGVLLLLTLLLLATPSQFLFWLIVFASLGLGYLLTISIGGADMPVVIALLNSYSGLAAAATGFILGNHALIISGSLVGASGLILTKIMCDAMNRPLLNVLFGTLGPTAHTLSADEVYQGVRTTSAEEAAMLLDAARKVMIVPGYGMAVAQAQHAVRDLASLLQSRGTEVNFGIHPVAGRMPGHMNVLLAEADIPYDRLKDLDEANALMDQADVCLVIGANDTVNPDARNNPQSPIAGMPIINADKAHACVVIKRSLSSGFAGIPNPLFAAENTLMIFEDGKAAVSNLVAALKSG